MGTEHHNLNCVPRSIEANTDTRTHHAALQQAMHHTLRHDTTITRKPCMHAMQRQPAQTRSMQRSARGDRTHDQESEGEAAAMRALC